MQKKLLDFAAELGLQLTPKSAELLIQYADLVWQKKDTLNLTSVSDKDEIITRHICDGLAGAGWIARLPKQEDLKIADVGTGAGYIGITIAITLPHVKMTLVESLQRRCMFLNWAILKLGLQNVQVENIRLGQHATGPFDVITERAMGQLDEVLPWVTPSLKETGVFVAYQSARGVVTENLLARLSLREEQPVSYVLPHEERERYLRIFKKHGHC